MSNLYNESINLHPIKGLDMISKVEVKHIENKTVIYDETEFVDPGDYIVVPIRRGVLIKPYTTNIFNKYKTKTGMIMSSDKSFFKSNDSGEVEQSERAIMCGRVINVSPLCDLLSPGDDIYYFAPVSNPIPFGNKGYVIIDENNIFCKMIKKVK